MFRAITPLRSASRLARVNIPQKRHQSLQIITDAPKLTTDLVVKEIESMLSGKDKTYQSRYPDKTLEDYEQELQAQLAKPIFYDEAMIDLVHKVLGFSREEVEYGFSGKLPELAVKERDGSYTINWKNIVEIYGRTDRESTRIDDLEKFFRSVQNAEQVWADQAKEEIEIDWADWEKRVGHKTASQVRTHLEDVLTRTKPELDVKKIEEAFDRCLQPSLDMLKDELFDKLGQITTYTNELVRETPLLKTDEFGMPIVNFDSPSLMDEFYPQERDEMIQEIDEDIWETNYTVEKKKLRLGPDELQEYNKDWVTAESLKLEEAAAIQIEGGAGLSAQKKEEEMIFKEVLEYGRKNKLLEAEVSSLKLQKELEADDSTKKETDTEKKEETVEQGMSDAQFQELMGKLVTKAQDDLRDFKHMSKEDIKNWAARDAEVRGEAEAELLRIQKGGKL